MHTVAKLRFVDRSSVDGSFVEQSQFTCFEPPLNLGKRSLVGGPPNSLSRTELANSSMLKHQARAYLVTDDPGSAPQYSVLLVSMVRIAPDLCLSQGRGRGRS